MKKITLLTLTVLTIATTTLKAQINKGSTALGGNVSFYSQKSTTDNSTWKQTSLYISPSFTSFYKDNRAFGFHLTFASTTDSFTNANQYGAGVFLRQYKTLGKGFYIFIQEDLSYYLSKPSRLYNGVKYTQSNIYFDLNPGIAYDLSKRIQFELVFLNDLLSASYTNIKYTSPSNSYKESSFNFGANTTITNLTTLNVGAKIFFGR